MAFSRFAFIYIKMDCTVAAFNDVAIAKLWQFASFIKFLYNIAKVYICHVSAIWIFSSNVSSKSCNMRTVFNAVWQAVVVFLTARSAVNIDRHIESVSDYLAILNYDRADIIFAATAITCEVRLIKVL